MMRWLAFMIVCGASAFSGRGIPSTPLRTRATTRQHMLSSRGAESASVNARARGGSGDLGTPGRTALRAKESDKEERPPGFGEGCLEPKDQAGLAFLAVLSGWHFFIGPVVREAVLAARVSM